MVASESTNTAMPTSSSVNSPMAIANERVRPNRACIHGAPHTAKMPTSTPHPKNMKPIP